MTGFLRVFAYICIGSTPFQIGLCLWGLAVVFSTDETITSLTNDVFLRDHLPSFYRVLKPLTYFILPDALANFIWSLPIVIHQFLKALVSTWLGIWILKELDRGRSNPTPPSG